MPIQPQSVGTAAILILIALIPGRAESQRRAPGPEWSLLIGPARYDLTSSGTGFAGQAGLAFRPVRRVLLLEPSLGYLTYRNRFGLRDHWFFPELSIQAEVRLGMLRPFVGGGAGAGVASLVGSDRWHGALHGVTGVRLHLGRDWGGRAEVRIRAVPPWSGHTTDFGFGVILGLF
jgi:hypothetical protein